MLTLHPPSSSSPPQSPRCGKRTRMSYDDEDDQPETPPPPPPPRLTVVLDLDETLVHSEPVDLHLLLNNDEADSCFFLHLDDFAKAGKKLLVRKRPYLQAFLAQAAAKFNLVVFTAGVEAYAAGVVQELDPTGTLFQRILSRQHCTPVAGLAYFYKDLMVLGGDEEQQLERTVLVDNSPLCFAKSQLANGIPIPSFFNDANDVALIHLSQMLNFLDQNHADVRLALPGMFPLEELVSRAEDRLVLSTAAAAVGASVAAAL